MSCDSSPVERFTDSKRWVSIPPFFAARLAFRCLGADHANGMIRSSMPSRTFSTNQGILKSDAPG